MAKWNIQITDFLGGFAPAWYNQGDYPSYGNKNHLADMTNIDLTAPNFLTQGPGLANLTNGTQAGVVTTLINSILDEAVASDETYGIGGAKLYKISSTAVTSDGTWPHTIDKGTVTAEDGEDCVAYQGNLYYTYNHSGSAGDIGKYDLASTFDDDWGSTVPSGMAALQGDVPHQAIVGGDNRLYITNGRYICTYDGSTLVPQALDLPTGTIIQSIGWSNDRLYISANKPDIVGTNNTSSVYIWDGGANSWEAEIRVMGRVAGILVNNGVVFLFYSDTASIGGHKLGYVSGLSIVQLAQFTGALPSFSQICTLNGFTFWVSGSSVWAFGSGAETLPLRLFQVADGGYSTVGGMATPFGTPIIASTESTNYKLAKTSGYDTACTAKTMMFDLTGEDGHSRINTLVFTFDALATGASCAFSLVDGKGVTIYSDTISYTKLGAATSVVYELNGKLAENVRVQLDFSSGSTSNPVKFKSIRLYGTTGK